MRELQRLMSWGGAVTLLFVALCWVAPGPAQAASVTYALDYIFSPATGSVAPLFFGSGLIGMLGFRKTHQQFI